VYFNGDTTSPGGRLHLGFAGSGALAFLSGIFESIIPYDIGVMMAMVQMVREWNKMRNQRQLSTVSDP
jgi:hypothetical protein